MTAPLVVPQGGTFFQKTRSLTGDEAQQIMLPKERQFSGGCRISRHATDAVTRHVHYCFRIQPANVGTLVSFVHYKAECNYNN